MELIYYKGKSKVDSEWVYGYLMYNDREDKYTISNYFSGFHRGWEIIGDTVCNSIGIFDSVDRYIFYKDVVECIKPYEKRITEENTPMIGVVVHEDGQYYLLFRDGTATEFDKSDTYKVIGNINDKNMGGYKELFESWKESILD